MCLAHSACYVREGKGRNTWIWTCICLTPMFHSNWEDLAKATWILNVRSGIWFQFDTSAFIHFLICHWVVIILFLTLSHSHGLDSPVLLVIFFLAQSGSQLVLTIENHYITSIVNIRWFLPPCFSFRACFCFFSSANDNSSND